MPTPITSSLTATAPSPLQSPTQELGVAVGDGWAPTCADIAATNPAASSKQGPFIGCPRRRDELIAPPLRSAVTQSLIAWRAYLAAFLYLGHSRLVNKNCWSFDFDGFQLASQSYG